MTQNLDDLFASEPLPEVDPPKVEPTPEEIMEQNFNSGLSESRGEEPEKPDEPEPPKEEPARLIAGYTEEEFKAVFEKAKKFDELDERLRQTHDKAFGKMGQMEQEFRELKQAKAAGKPISKESFKSLVDYFGDEDVAEAFANDLSELQLGGGNSVDAEALQAAFDEKLTAMNERFEAATQEFETKLLTLQHPDWEELKDSEDFAAWQNTLKPEARELLMSTWDGATLSQAFTKFKSWRTERDESAKKKEQRLLDAMPVNGSGGRGHSAAEDAFNQGKNSVVRERLTMR